MVSEDKDCQDTFGLRKPNWFVRVAIENVRLVYGYRDGGSAGGCGFGLCFATVGRRGCKAMILMASASKLWKKKHTLLKNGRGVCAPSVGGEGQCIYCFFYQKPCKYHIEWLILLFLYCMCTGMNGRVLW